MICLDRIEGWHMGGELRRLEGFSSQAHASTGLSFEGNGWHMVGQMYAQCFHVAQPRLSVPLALWHGGGMSGATWETTPDGRPGWLSFFLRESFSVVLCDAFERGRASLPAWPQAFDGVPEYRALDAVWHHFRFGPPAGAGLPLAAPRAAAYAGQQFPVEQLAHFARQFVPRFTNSDDCARAAYGALLQRLEACAVIGHSQGAAYALDAALAEPRRVAAVVALEPPVSQACLQRLKSAPPGPLPPHCLIFGDHIRQRHATWEPFLHNAMAYCEELAARDVPVSFIELPERGIRGNSHMLHMDANSDCIAALARDWLLGLPGLARG